MALPRDRKVLLAASTGGHLAQLVMVARALRLHPDSMWVTFDTPQSRSLLLGRRVTHVPYIKPRGYAAALRAAAPIHRLLRRERFDAALSTGSAIAAPALGAAATRGLPAYYLESMSRFDGPSMTGRLMAKTPGIRCYTQHAAWACGRWSYDFSILEHVIAGRPSGEIGGGRDPRTCFVTLGTIAPYRFDSLVDNLVAVRPAAMEVTWQLGSTTRTGLPGRAATAVGTDEFDRLATAADVVVSHAGVGSALRLLDLGVTPLLVPRRQRRGEHVDDHQLQAARELERAGLVHLRESGTITAADLRAVAVDRSPASPPARVPQAV